MDDDTQRQQVDWAAVRRAYEQNEETLARICIRFGITKSALEYRQHKHSWPSRQLLRSIRRGTTLSRLFAVLEQQVAKLANAGGETLGDKEAQQLTELVRNFDKMATIANAETKVEILPPKRSIEEKRAKLAKKIDQYNRR